MITKTYPIVIRCEKNDQIINTLFFFRHVINFYLRQLYNEEAIGKLDEKKFAYKCLENLAINKRYYIPCRINRGLLEIVGRNLRTIKDRRELYSLLLLSEEEPEKWDYKLLRQKDNIYKKSQYVENVKEQAKNYLQKNDRQGACDRTRLPDDYLDLANVPKLKNGMISYAPDDEQAIKFVREDNKINVSLKVLKEDRNEPSKRSDWEWIDFSFSLPDVLSTENLSLASPDLRVLSGKLVPVLDFKIEVSEKKEKESSHFVTVDWGVNKLVTICVFNEDGEQISRPFFLKCDAIQKKLLRIRKEIDTLQGKRDKLPEGDSKAKWHNKEIARRWNKFRQIQKQLSHLAGNVIVIIAKIYNCSKIYVEWLGSLKSKKLSNTLNWKINSTVRQQIYDKVEYKASLAGISLEKPINPAFTSQFCPKCGQKGHHVKASDKLNKKVHSGGWFYCKNCGYNADRDYVATQNIARKALYGNKLKSMSKTFVYTAKVISDKLFRQSISLCEGLCHNLNGWKNSVFLRPVYLVAGTLRL